MDLNVLERRVATDRRAAADRSADAELQLATSLCDLAKALVATRADGPRDRTAEALEPAQQAVEIRLHWFTAGLMSARLAGEIQDALRIFDQAARAVGHRELATTTIRRACDAYRRVAHTQPHGAAMCADALAKCGVWLLRLDPATAVAATEDAAAIRGRLFAADPALAGKYLASLNTLLRTLTIGRQRKQALAMYRERYSAWTTAEMTKQLRELTVAELEFTGKTIAALTKLDCRTLQGAGRLTQQQILYQSAGDLATIEEINWKLALVGLKPLAAGALPDQPSRPVEIATSFGALSVRCSAPDAVKQVRAAVLAAYEVDGARLVRSSNYLGVHEKHWSVPAPELNADTVLGDDVVLIERGSGSWVAVKSLAWEVAPTGSHPLALRLAERWPVVSVTATEQMSYELCWYEEGAPAQYAALGRPAGAVTLDVPLAPLDFAVLADYGADYASETQVRAAFGNTAMFAKLTELPSSGIRQAAEARALADYGEDVLFFRSA
ncbi:hypothetical protein [Nocardia jiangsuensis]|uniref:Uncharacterized protein n=1 Tax=Nocardia jiangsuensis TaxID=1691563 RepID=A0ABV8DX70_9NOCA